MVSGNERVHIVDERDVLTTQVQLLLVSLEIISGHSNYMSNNQMMDCSSCTYTRQDPLDWMMMRLVSV